jgi:hypothetical protein
MHEPSARPWNWCDRRCERCPLAFDCAVNLRVEERKREAVKNGLDPDDPNVVMSMVRESFREAIEILKAEVPDTEREPEPRSSEGSELYEAGLRYLKAIDSVCEDATDAELGLASEARLIGMILVGKTARLLDGLPIARDSIMREDTVLTLLLIGHLERQAAAMVMAIGAERTSRLFGYQRARRDLRRLLDVHLSGIERGEREAVERMTAAGRAPSPFCTTVGPPLRAA